MPDYRLPLDELPDPLPIDPIRGPVDVSITPPGSKSLTNRAYLLAALAAGTSRIGRPLRSDDCDRMLAALDTLGAASRFDGDDVLIDGVGGRFPRGGEVNLGDGGTPTRFMIAAACLAAEPVLVDGSPRMRERPIAEGVDLLRRIGARIEYVEVAERLPVRVTPSGDLRGGEVTATPTVSSQFLSALLLVAPSLPDGLRLAFDGPVTSAAYVRMTEAILAEWGLLETTTAPRIDEPPPPVIEIAPRTVPARSLAVAPDASSAVYWRLAESIVPGARVGVSGLRDDSCQPDLAVVRALGRITGAGGDGTVHAFEFDAGNCPDGALALAVAAARADGRSTITGLRTLRVKETDRIAALAAELRRVGCGVQSTDESITIDPAPLDVSHEVTVRTYDDHRMAMAFAVLGLVRRGISIADPGCVAKSYPGFFADLALLHD
ncbi:MAG: 3-phosphoshikimate 1-carboxyvinyltransferase [Planctomycetes bacterium]|nr:3-phosphoshikimate 1-carboxyvinyltransferase [Planctomycetota bacterium]